MPKFVTAAILAAVFSNVALADSGAAAKAVSAAKPVAGAPADEAARIEVIAKAQLAQLDTNKDGKVSKAEFMTPGEQMFAKVDADKNGFVTESEIVAMFRERVEAQKAAMKAQAEARTKMMQVLKDAEAKAGKQASPAPAK